MLTTIEVYMRVKQSKYTKTNPKIFSNGGMLLDPPLKLVNKAGDPNFLPISSDI